MTTVIAHGAAPGGPAEIAAGDVTALARRWWAVALRGLVSLALGVLAVLRPGATLAALVLLFAAYAFADGALHVVAALRLRAAGGEAAADTDRRRRWGMLLAAGAAGLAAAAVSVLRPDVTTLFLVYLIAAWALVTGASEIASAFRLRQAIRGEWLLGLSGALSVLFGLALMVAPGAGALALAVWLGAYAAAAGVVLLALALRLRAYARHRDEAAAGGRPPTPGQSPADALSTSARPGPSANAL